MKFDVILNKIKEFFKGITKETWIKFIIYVSIIVFGFTLDRVTKEIVDNKFELGVSKQVELIPDFLYFAYVRNTGGAWSILSNATWVLTIISIVSVVVISIYIFKKKVNMFNLIACSMIVAGGLGNLFDRIIYGAVIDFIESFPFGYAFPIFNVADIFVVIGAIIIIAYTFYEDYVEKKKSQQKILTEEELNNKDDNDGRNN